MSTAPLEAAIASTRTVLGAVDADQLEDMTPCAQWKVSDLINHIVGGQYFFTSSVKGEQMGGNPPNFAAGDFRAAFDEGARAAVAAFSEDGAMDRIVTLPFGQMPGSVFVSVATLDTFQHGWDLAKATGQSTDLAPELAENLLAGARGFIGDQFRSPEGTVFGPERTAPDGACSADRLAAFLGRSV
jgi:uncharacterized protein (TIGR03086 family)